MILRAGRIVAVSLAVLLASAQGAAANVANAEQLKSFFNALAQTEAGTRSRPVHILQLGDSHTAADHIAGGLRARLQARFGEAGRGAMPPGRPFAAYNPRQVEVAQSDGWRLDASFLPGPNAHPAPGDPVLAGGPYGLSGWRLTSTKAGATVTLKADPEGRFDRVVLCGLTAPDGGTLIVEGASSQRRVAMAGPAGRPVCEQIDYSAPQSSVQMRSDGGPVTLLSFATFREGRGVALSNLGVIGTRLQDFAARDDALVAAELKAYAPDLILLAYGTNEGFQPVDPAAYEQVVRDQIKRLKRLAPGTPILMLGPPDAQTIRPDIPEDGKHNLNFSCAPLTPDEARDYPKLVAARAAQLARWYAPPGLSQVREAQRRAAAAEGAAFWDWEERMGGPCSAHLLSKADPRLVRGDHIHFTSGGGDLVADLLSKDLMAAYAASGEGKR